MADHIQFEDFEAPTRQPHCIACEEMLADALDDSLSPTSQFQFDRHIASCAPCARMVADAQRGAAWLELLKAPRPEPSATLLDRILAQTAAAQTSDSPATLLPQVLPATPYAVPANVLPFRPSRIPAFMTRLPHVMYEPRLALTAAMAFFSIALTMNLTGVRLSDLKPTSLKHTYYAANADATRYYNNLRVVHVVEARVDELRDPALRDNANQPEPTQSQPQSAPDQKKPAENSQPDKAQPQSDLQPAPSPNKQNQPVPGISRSESPAPRPRLLLADEKFHRTTHSQTTGGLV